MSADEADFWRAVKAARKERREKYGLECPECQRLRPKRSPTILLPGQRCLVDGYRDPRPRLPEGA